MEIIDEIKYMEEIYEVSIRDASIEINHARNRIIGQRILNKNLIIITTNAIDPINYRQYSSWASEAVKRIKVKEISKWFYGNYYNGSVTIGSDNGVDPLVDIVKYAYDQLTSKGLKVEVIGIFKKIKREHRVFSSGSEAVEERYLYELYMYPYTVFYGKILASSKLIADNNVKGLYNRVDKALEQVYKDIISKSRSKRLNPIYTGKWHIIFSGESAPIIYHEIIHLLQGDEPLKLPRGYRFEADLTIIEDPFCPGPLQRLFDDEVYPAWRRVLVEKGIVIDYLHTRTTVDQGSKPGNARGLFTRSKPLHHQLIVKPGDWGFDEMVFESRRSIIVESIIEAKLGGNYIWIHPENSYVAERDRLTPVNIDLIAIPLSRIRYVIMGIGKELQSRYSFEKGHPVYEKAPYTLIEARVIV